MGWVRLWSDMPTDPKFRVIARRAGRSISEVVAVFVFMLANAGERNERGGERGELHNWADDDVAAALDLDPAAVAAIREAMQGKVLTGDKLTGWEKRQPKREDGSSERAREWRERKRTQANAEKRPDTDTDTDTEADNKQAARDGKAMQPETGAAAGQSATPCGLKAAFNGSTDLMVQSAMGWMNCPEANARQWLQTLLSANGADAVLGAYSSLIASQAQGSPVASPIRYWSKTAATLKSQAAGAGGRPKAAAGGGVADALARRVAAKAEAGPVPA